MCYTVGMTTYTIKSYSALRTAATFDFDQAVNMADRWAAEGGLPSTITSDTGGRWTKWAGSPVELQERPRCPLCGGDCESIIRDLERRLAAVKAVG